MQAQRLLHGLEGWLTQGQQKEGQPGPAPGSMHGYLFPLRAWRTAQSPTSESQEALLAQGALLEPSLAGTLSVPRCTLEELSSVLPAHSRGASTSTSHACRNLPLGPGYPML